MREYKFRGKRIDNGEWVYGNLLTYFNKPAIQDYAQTNGEIFLVDPDTVGQYTGLKDRNGKEIYEGDIIQFEDMGEVGYEYKEGYDFINRAIVTFENGRFTLDEFMDTNSGVVEELADHEETYSVIKHSEVIGNRWDNPDLLEGGYE